MVAGYAGFTLQVTERCNLRCRYCYVSWRKNRGPDCSPELCTRFVDFALRESRDRFKITFFGGEPLLRPDLIRHTVDYARNAATGAGKTVSFHIVTNGTLLDDKTGDFIADNRIGLEVSIDGPPSVHDTNRPRLDGSGSFAAVYKNLCRFVDRHPNHPVSIFSVITSPASLPWLQALCRGIEAEGFTANPCRMPFNRENPASGDADSPYRFLDQKLDLFREAFLRGDADHGEEVSHRISCLLGLNQVQGCGAGADAVIVTQSGQIFPCPMFVGHPEMVIGDLAEGFYRDKVRPFAKRSAAVECAQCSARCVCGGGCAYDSFEQSGRIDLPARANCHVMRNYADRLEKNLISIAAQEPEQLLDRMGELPGAGCRAGEPGHTTGSYLDAPAQSEDIATQALPRRPPNPCAGHSEPDRSLSPNSYVVKLTDGCNLACDYCYEKGRVRGNASMDHSTALRVAEYILGGQTQTPLVCLFGGEPLLNWETGRFLMEKIATGAVEFGKKPSFHIVTNGTRITPEIARDIALFNVTVQISIDGGRERNDRHRKFGNGAGTFDAITRGVELLLAANPEARIDAQVVLTPGNTDMVGIARDLADMNFRRISFLVRAWADGSGAGWSMDEIGAFGRSREDFFPFFLESVIQGRPEVDMGFASMVAAEPEGLQGLCECGSGEVFIDTAGFIHTCPQLHAAGAPPIGNCVSPMDRHATPPVYESPFRDSGLPRPRPQRPHGLEVSIGTKPVPVGDDCRECWAFERCRGGCMIHCQRCPWMTPAVEAEKQKAWCALMRNQFARAIIARRLLDKRYPDSLRKLESMFGA